MIITAQLVKELRERTNAGILDAKKALEATNGDIEKAIKHLQETGAIKAAKKAGRISAEGQVFAIENGNKAFILELNCETDFVAMNDKFKKLIQEIASAIADSQPTSLAQALEIKLHDKSINEVVTSATATIGEKIDFRRLSVLSKNNEQVFGVYNHSNGKISSIVLINGVNKEVAKNISMHVAAMNPEYLNQTFVPSQKLEEFKSLIRKEMASIDKPENVKEMMLQGKLKKQLSEITLEDQTFVMENKISVGQYAKQNATSIISYVRFEVGEGIEKKEVDFVSEVNNQIKK